jgi:hypothetical protein
MARDHIIEDVRKLREDLFARYGYDLNRYVNRLNQKPGRAPKPGSKPVTPKAKSPLSPKSKTTKRSGKGRAA